MSRRVLQLMVLLVVIAASVQLLGADQRPPGALSPGDAAALCPLSPGQAGSVQLFDNQGGDAYIYFKNCGEMVSYVAAVNLAAKNSQDFYFIGVGGVL
jgi:hypothetical protein